MTTSHIAASTQGSFEGLSRATGGVARSSTARSLAPGAPLGGGQAFRSSLQDELNAQVKPDVEDGLDSETKDSQTNLFLTKPDKNNSILDRLPWAFSVDPQGCEAKQADQLTSAGQDEAQNITQIGNQENQLNPAGHSAVSLNGITAAKASLLKAGTLGNSTRETKNSKLATGRDQAVHERGGTETNAITSATIQADGKQVTEDDAGPKDKSHNQQSSGTDGVAENAPLDRSEKPATTNCPTGDLAVAMQVKARNSDQSSTANSTADTSEKRLDHGDAAVVAQSDQSSMQSRGGEQQPWHHAPETMEGTASVLASDTRHSANPEKTAPEATKSAAERELDPEVDKLRSEPVRGAHVQISGENDQKVDVRLFERGGSLSVTVRSGDTNLTRALQDHVPELTSKLSLDHFRTETWTPNSSRNAEQRNAENGSSSDKGGRGQDEQNTDQRQNKKNQQQPDWIDELEAHPVPFFRKG